MVPGARMRVCCGALRARMGATGPLRTVVVVKNSDAAAMQKRRYLSDIIDENINFAGPCKRFNAESKMSIVGVPINMGQPKAGTSRGPNALREAGLIGDLRDKLGWTVRDLGDVPVDNRPHDDMWGKIKNPVAVGKANEETFRIV